MQGIPNRGIKMFGFLAALGSAALEALGSTAATVGEGAALAGEGASLAAGGAAGGTAGIAAGSVAAAADSALASAGNLGEAAAGEGAGLLNGPKDFFAQAWQNTKDDLGNAWDDVAIKNPDGSVNGWKTAGNLGYKTAKGLVMGLGKKQPQTPAMRKKLFRKIRPPRKMDRNPFRPETPQKNNSKTS